MKRKIGSVLLSLACAFGLWLYVITTVSPGSTDTYYNIPIVWEGESVLNENGLMVTAVSSNTVNLRLSGNRSDLSKVNSANITIKADLSKIREPGTQIPISYTTPTFPGDVASNAFVIESKEPDTIYVTVVKRISKTVPVEVTWVGTTAEGFMIDRENKTLDYPEVTVTGPESVVNTIDRATITVDLDGRRESISESYTYTLCDKNGDPVDARLHHYRRGGGPAGRVHPAGQGPAPDLQPDPRRRRGCGQYHRQAQRRDHPGLRKRGGPGEPRGIP